MKLLLVHNRYMHFGGEDTVFDFECSLLAAAGHQVHQAIVANDVIDNVMDKVRAALAVSWSSYGYKVIRDAIARTGPELVHVHNFFPLLSPSIYDAAAEAGVPVVQTLHNFRIVCPNGMLMRDSVPCELCLTGSPYYGLRYRCYRNTLIGSAALAHMVAHHRRARTWQSKVARFIALSEFARSRFLIAGIPPEKITLKPNAVADPGAPARQPGAYLLYVGRLSHEKGVRILINAARRIRTPIRIAGDGPLRKELEAVSPANVTFLGQLPKPAVLNEMKGARSLVLPSICYENLPTSLLEAYASGLPVIASNIGSLTEYVQDNITGLHVPAGDEKALAAALERVESEHALVRTMGQAARKVYEEQFTPPRILERLELIYREVKQECRG